MGQLRRSWLLLVVVSALAISGCSRSTGDTSLNGLTSDPTRVAAAAVMSPSRSGESGETAADGAPVGENTAFEDVAEGDTTTRSETARNDANISTISASIDQLGTAPPTSAASESVPRAVVDRDEFDFGVMDPFEHRTHTFVIRNEGTAPLTLTQGPTTCKCTLGEVAEGAIPPGGETSVTLSWTTSQQNKFFAQEAEVFTNDPEHQSLIFRIRGEILTRLKADPQEFTMPGVVPGERLHSKVTISSEVWDDFEIFDLKSSLETLQWSIERVDNVAAQELGIKCGYRVTVEAPNDLPHGYFSHWLRMQIRPLGESSRLYEMPINGTVLRRVSVYGKGVDSTGMMKLGKIPRGTGLTQNFLVKVRDRDPELHVKSIHAVPDFLNVSLQPHEHGEVPGLYRMVVEVPKSAPRAVHMAEPGRIRIEFENPRFETLDFRVEFAILGENDF